jgi:putative effector of murein hydrolase
MRAVNLLTPELRSAQKGPGASRPSAMETSGGIGAFIVLGVLALVVAGVAGSVLANNVVKERTATLAQVSAKNDATVKHCLFIHISEPTRH